MRKEEGKRRGEKRGSRHLNYVVGVQRTEAKERWSMRGRRRGKRDKRRGKRRKPLRVSISCVLASTRARRVNEKFSQLRCTLTRKYFSISVVLSNEIKLIIT